MKLNVSSSENTIVKAKKSDKKDIMRFYKNQRYSASFIGQDQCYIVKRGDFIIASAIVSAGQGSDDCWLLHGLVTNKDQRGENIASLLLQTIFSEQNALKQARYQQIVCFADIALQPFYQKNHFISYNSSKNIAQLPLEFKERLLGYRAKQQSLHCFLYSAN
tara:strand:- start:291 stop:776 length:486 start_codon:yes stop_codon:yes gene_type:complete